MTKPAKIRATDASRGPRRWARFSLRGTFVLVTAAACVGGLFATFVRPAASESGFLFKLRSKGAQVTGKTIVPTWLSKYVDRQWLQYATKIDLQTPQATIVFLKEPRRYPNLCELIVVGSAIDLPSIENIRRRNRLQKLTLDSTVVTDRQFVAFQKRYPEIDVTRIHRWQHARIDQAPQYPKYYVNDPLATIELINHLRAIGKVNAIETLDWYAIRRKNRKPLTIRFLVPLVFEQVDPTEKLPIRGSRRYNRQFQSTSRIIREATSMDDLLDELESWDDGRHLSWHQNENAYYLDAESWPTLDGICFSGDIPFGVKERTSGGGSWWIPGSPRYLLKWAAERARLIDQPLMPVDDPHVAAAELVTQLQRYSDLSPSRISRLEEQIHEDAAKMLAGLSRPTRWNAEMQRYESARR